MCLLSPPTERTSQVQVQVKMMGGMAVSPPPPK